MSRHIWTDDEGLARFVYYDKIEDIPGVPLGSPAVKTIPEGYGDLTGKLVFILNPMGQEPWKIVKPIAAPNHPDSVFMAIFGPPPLSEEFRDEPNPSLAFRIARIRYRQDQSHFLEGGFPPWATPEDIIPSNAVFELWEMEEPAYYEGRYGWMAKWLHLGFEASAYPALKFSHLIVAQYQIKVIGAGGTVEHRHPLVPPLLSQRKASMGA